MVDTGSHDQFPSSEYGAFCLDRGDKTFSKRKKKPDILDKQANLHFSKVYFKALSNSHFSFFHLSTY